MTASVHARDIPWAAGRITRKAIFSALPIRAHVEIALLRGRIPSVFRGVPDHVRDNIQAILGDSYTPAGIDRVARRHFQFIKRAYLVEILPLLSGFQDPGKWPVSGLEHLDGALAQTRGAILTTGHFGYPRLIGPILEAHGYQVRQVVAEGTDRSTKKRRHEEWIANGSGLRRWLDERTRVAIERVGPRDIVAGLDVRPIFDALARNQAVMIVGDGMRAVEFARLSFLGRTYPFPTGFMKIAMLTKAPVLPTFVVDGNRSNRIRLEIHPPLPIDPEGDVLENLQLFVDVLDAQVRHTPYLWNRWNVKNVFETALQWSESEVRGRHDARWHQPKRRTKVSRLLE